MKCKENDIEHIAFIWCLSMSIELVLFKALGYPDKVNENKYQSKQKTPLQFIHWPHTTWSPIPFKIEQSIQSNAFTHARDNVTNAHTHEHAHHISVKSERSGFNTHQKKRTRKEKTTALMIKFRPKYLKRSDKPNWTNSVVDGVVQKRYVII